jgi:hypothetical protein
MAMIIVRIYVVTNCLIKIENEIITKFPDGTSEQIAIDKY